jgi:hypothetical protein
MAANGLQQECKPMKDGPMGEAYLDTSILEAKLREIRHQMDVLKSQEALVLELMQGGRDGYRPKDWPGKE